jgi:nitrate reductase (NAD(P)H)
MMPKYHIGSLDEASMKVLSEGDVQEQTTTAPPRATFLQSRSWTKAILHEKQTISWDTRIFKFKLEHTEQTLGLPIGQHLMIRLRDPVTREAIIRSYTPISEPKQQGFMDVLVKVYFDQPGAKGGKMSQSLDGLPIGHHVEFKGPIGKFEYLGRGKCTVNEKPRSVGKFLMICGGSGITPILQVFRAVAQDKADPTKCLVLDSNRLVEDILCREDLDSQRKGNEDRLQVVHTLTKATDEWTGLRGRVNGELVSKYCEVEKGTMVLVCGPQALEKSIHQALLTLGWSDEQILFF